MSNENDFLIGAKVKESDFITFVYSQREYSYKYKNFKKTLGEKISGQISSLSKIMRESGGDAVMVDNNSWKDGIPCELLQDGIEKKGKIRLKVIIEFIPDEVEVIQGVEGITDKRSPLDDIRQINM